jgi:hypothetical protein
VHLSHWDVTTKTFATQTVKIPTPWRVGLDYLQISDSLPHDIHASMYRDGWPSNNDLAAIIFIVVMRPPLVHVGTASILFRLSRRHPAVSPTRFLSVFPRDWHFTSIVVHTVFVAVAPIPIPIIIIVLVAMRLPVALPVFFALPMIGARHRRTNAQAQTQHKHRHPSDHLCLP